MASKPTFGASHHPTGPHHPNGRDRARRSSNASLCGACETDGLQGFGGDALLLAVDALAQLHAASTRLQGEQGLSQHIAGIPIKGMLLRRQQRFPFQWEATYFVVSWGLAVVFSSEDFSAAPQKMLRLTGDGVAFAPLSASQAGGQAFAFTVVADVSLAPLPLPHLPN
jgi:hypothetical protein